MDLLQELLLTVCLSVFLAFLLSHIAPAVPRSVAMDLGESSSAAPAAEGEGSELTGAVEVHVLDRRTVDVRSEEENVAEGGVGVDEIAVEEEVKVERETVPEDEEVEVEDWEGVERSEIGKLFGVAVAFADGGIGAELISKLSAEGQMELYALRKVALEGPCYENQPLALKASTRARWHAWQKLGNMDQEAAMEQYINLLSDKIPGWMDGEPRVENECVQGNTSSVVTEVVTSESSLEQNKVLIE